MTNQVIPAEAVEAAASRFDMMPPGSIVRSHCGNEWRKRSDGLWDVLSDPMWSPCTSADLPHYATPQGGNS